MFAKFFHGVFQVEPRLLKGFAQLDVLQVLLQRVFGEGVNLPRSEVGYVALFHCAPRKFLRSSLGCLRYTESLEMYVGRGSRRVWLAARVLLVPSKFCADFQLPVVKMEGLPCQLNGERGSGCFFVIFDSLR